MTEAKRDENSVPVLLGISSVDLTTPIPPRVNPATGRLLTEPTGAAGGTSMTDDSPFTVGTTAFTPAGGTYRSTRDLVDDNDGGAFAMTQRRALLTVIETPNGDSAMDEANDALRVNVVAGAGGGVAQADNSAFTANTTQGTPFFGFYDDTAPAAMTENRAGAVRMSQNRNLYIQIRDAAGNERGANVDANNNVNAILAANSGVDIGDVDVTSVIPRVGATNLGKAEDAAHASGDVGVQALAVRTDTPVNRSGADGDYEPIQIAAGRVWVSATVDAALPAGTNNIGDVDILSVIPGVTATSLGKAVDTASGATDTVVAVGFVRDDALTTLTPADGDYVRGRTNNRGALWVQHDGGLNVQGDVAHDAADSGNPQKIGGKAKETDGTDPGSVAEDDRTDAYFDRNGRQLVNDMHPNSWSATENNATAQTNNELRAAPGAGLRLYITDIVASNGATAGTVRFVENTGTPVIVLNDLYLAANGGGTFNFRTPIRLSVNVNFGYTSVTVTTHTVFASGYIAP